MRTNVSRTCTACVIALTLLLLPVLPAWAGGERGVIGEPARLLDAPLRDAGVLADLAVGTEVVRLERQDGWLHISVPAAPHDDGWIRVWQYRETAVSDAASEDRDALSGLQRFSRAATGFFSRDPEPDDDGDVTAAIGTRGLGLGETGRATPDPAARRQVDAYRVDASAARSFARDAELTR